jgi:hypothetical protein
VFAHHFIVDYLNTYLAAHPQRVKDPKLFPHYVSIIDHLLSDAKFTPKSTTEVEAALREVLAGKKVVEAGCRAGDFSHFLQEHGAILAASTSDPYYDTAQERFGPSTLLVKGKIQTAWKALKKEKPDILISFNLFDLPRFPPYGTEPARPAELLETLPKIAAPHTRIYVAPAPASGFPAIFPSNFETVAKPGSLEHKTTTETGVAKLPFFHTYRYQAHPRFFRKRA